MKIKNIHFVYKLFIQLKILSRSVNFQSVQNNSYYFPFFDPEQKIREKSFELILLTSPKKKKKDSFVSILKKSHTVLIGRLLYSTCGSRHGSILCRISERERGFSDFCFLLFSFETGLFVFVVIDYDERAMLTGNWLVYLVFR